MKFFIGVLATCCLASCQAATSSTATTSQYAYKVTENGGPYQKDKTVYESLGEKSLTVGQKYTIVGQTDATRQPHILIADITRYYGDKKDDVATGTMVVMQNGTYSFPCEKTLFDLKVSDKDSDIPNVSCKLKLIGAIPISAHAEMAVSQSS